MEIYQIMEIWGLVKVVATISVGMIAMMIVLDASDGIWFFIAVLLLIAMAYLSGFADGALMYID